MSIPGTIHSLFIGPVPSGIAAINLPFNTNLGAITNSSGVVLTNQYVSSGVTFSGNILLFSAAFMPGGVTPLPSTTPPQGFIAGDNFTITLTTPVPMTRLTIDWSGVGVGPSNIRFVGSTGSTGFIYSLPYGTSSPWVTGLVLAIPGTIGNLQQIIFNGGGIALDNIIIAP